jgi:hypothetical protein
MGGVGIKVAIYAPYSEASSSEGGIRYLLRMDDGIKGYQQCSTADQQPHPNVPSFVLTRGVSFAGARRDDEMAAFFKRLGLAWTKLLRLPSATTSDVPWTKFSQM